MKFLKEQTANNTGNKINDSISFHILNIDA